VLPTNIIVGYGSLMTTPSPTSTAKQEAPAIPVRVAASLGYVRAWNSHAEGFTALGLRKPQASETALTINGVLFPVTEAELEEYAKRENRYDKLELKPSQIEAVGWQRLPETGHIWIFVPREADPQVASPAPPDAEHPLLESYIDVAAEGGLEYGDDFAREILETTVDWNAFWLNDRELARRPWVHDPKAAAVDALLKSAATTKDLYKWRVFPEAYADRLRGWAGK